MLQFQPQEHLLHSYIVASQSEQARDRLSLDLAAAGTAARSMTACTRT